MNTKVRITTYMTERQYEEIKKAAQWSGMSLSAYLVTNAMTQAKKDNKK